MPKGIYKRNPEQITRVFIIAEAGKNFIRKEVELSTEEYLFNAKKLAKIAKEAGSSSIKFQTHELDELPKRDQKRKEWIERNIRATPREFWEKLQAYCEEIEIEFMSTPMSKGAAQKLFGLVKRWKVASPDVVDRELVEYLLQTNLPIIASTGMSFEYEINDFVSLFLKEYDLTLLHCKSIYPCPIDRLNLKAMETLKKYGYKVGFSDHTDSLTLPAVAVGMGASVIEKHFTLDKDDWGPDHAICLEPDEFKEMVQNIREAELSLGTGELFVDTLEEDKRKIFRMGYLKNFKK